MTIFPRTNILSTQILEPHPVKTREYIGTPLIDGVPPFQLATPRGFKTATSQRGTLYQYLIPWYILYVPLSGHPIREVV